MDTTPASNFEPLTEADERALQPRPSERPTEREPATSGEEHAQ